MSDGGNYPYGGSQVAQFGQSAASSAVAPGLVAPIVAASSPTVNDAFWLAAADGGVFGYPNEPIYGSLALTTLAAPIVGIVATHDGGGYWLVGADGGVFSFGDAPFLGSLPSLGVYPTAPIVGMASTPSGQGYWLVGADGGVFSFGDAPYLGAMAGHALDGPMVAIATP